MSSRPRYSLAGNVSARAIDTPPRRPAQVSTAMPRRCGRPSPRSTSTGRTTRKLGADIALTIPGVEGPKADVTPDVEHSVTASSSVQAQYEKLGIDITSDFLRIIRESETGGDTVGNTTVSLAMQIDPETIGPTEADKPAPRRDPELVLRVTDVKLPNEGESADVTPKLPVAPQLLLPHCALIARVWMLYDQRHILDATNEYFEEARQHIAFVHDSDGPWQLQMMSADEVSPPVWSIAYEPPPAGAAPFVTAHLGGGDPRRLVFPDYATASQFAHWLRTHPGQMIGDLQFDYTAGRSIYPGRTTGPDCPRPPAAG